MSLPSSPSPPTTTSPPPTTSPPTTSPPSTSPPPTTPSPARGSWHVALYSDVEKSGYLTKRRSGHRRYFVLRGACHSARLECHDSRESWLGKGPPAKDAHERGARGPLARLARWPLAHLPGLRQRPRRVVPLCGLMHVVERSDERCPHGLALLTDSAYLALGAPDEAEQRAWLSALRALVAVDGAKLGGPWGALPAAPGGGGAGGGPGAHQRQQLLLLDAWQGELLSQDLGLTTLLAGPCRVFFYTEHLHYVSPARGPRTDATRVIVSLFCIKYFGHSDDCFFITLGNSSDLGPGQIWMRVEDDTMAAAIHHNLLLAVEELSLCRMWSRPQPPRPKLCSSASTARRRLGSSGLRGHAPPQRAPRELPGA
uniref:Insulin receptor substrate 2-like isoform X1 n=1 Tax=Petromyzon marinus TaxID=7757 RepID=A0AAJ7TSU6_PETMA|nr:insulin receptor substrate 2-like isoform X1 [Petromyzon marinus]